MYRSKLGIITVAMVVVAVCLSGAWGQANPATSQTNQNPPSSLTDLTLEQLGNVEVTSAAKTPEQVWKTAAAIFVITHDDIERSGVTCIPEALRLAPGVEVARIDANKWSIGIRGFGSRLSRSVLVMIDGRTVYTTFFAGTYWEVQDTFMPDIDRIEVIRGPGGTIWGPNAVNGIINIITKSSKDTQGTMVEAGGGNIEEGFAGIRHGGGNGTNFTYRAYVKGFRRSSEYHPTQPGFDDAWEAGQTGFRMDWDKDARDSFTLEGDLYDEAAGESVSAVTYNPPASLIVDQDARLSGGNITGHWHRTEGERKDTQLEVFYDRTNRHEPNLGDLRNTFDIDFNQRLPLGTRQELSLGAGARWSHGNELEVVSGLVFIPSERTDQLYTVFAQDEIALIPNRLSLIGGSKFLKTNYTGLELEPTVRLLWTPTDTQTLWLAASRAVRTPADVERDLFLSGLVSPNGGPGGIPFFARFNANANFQSEKLKGYEAGYRRLLGKKVYVDIATFYNQYHGLLDEEITGAPFIETDPAPTHLLLPAQFANGLMATTSGGEIAPEWKPAKFWRLRGSYSFLEMHVEKQPGSGDIGTAPSIQGSSPVHQALVQSDFDFGKSFSLDLDYRYVSKLPGQGVPAYSTADANFTWRANERISFSVVGQNLLQPHHAEFGSDPGGLVQIKRGVYGKVVWTR